MAYLNTNTRTASATKNDKIQPPGRVPMYTGVYLGFVKKNDDVQRNGRLSIWIPELGSAPDNPDGWVLASYCSPFAGSTNVKSISKTNIEAFDTTQTSYGFWMVPPDLNNQVLVMFINGDSSRPIWIGCFYGEYANEMIPGMASNSKNWQYPGKQIPVAEYNRWDTSVTNPDRAFKPYEKVKFKGVGNQGLIKDRARGTTTSSARREAPSNVYGILTPGPPIDPDVPQENIRRKGGSSLVMDDGIGTEYVQLATKTGAQIRIDETNGFVYLINRDGTAWIEMDKDGNIDIFGAKNISMRSQRDFNIRADRNVNIEAGQNVFIKAAKDTIESTTTFTYDVNNIPQTTTIPYWQYVGEKNGSGGNIVFQALDQMHSTTENDVMFTSKQGNINFASKNSFLVTTEEGSQNFNSKAGILLTTEGSLDLSTNGNIRASSNGTVSLTGIGDTIICTNSNLSLNAAGQIIVTSGDKTSMDATSVEIGTVVKVPTIEAQLSKSVATETNSIKSNTIAYDGQPLDSGYSGGATPPDPSAPISGQSPMAASPAQAAEIKAMVEKVNILATWAQTLSYPEWQRNTTYKTGDIVTYAQVLYISKKGSPPSNTFEQTYWELFIPEDKFKRNSQSIETTVTRLPTYEPCPEHVQFSYADISGYTPKQTEADATYNGSGGAGNNNTQQPPDAITPGSNNTQIPPESPSDNTVTKDFNLDAFKCQLSIHEGYKTRTYKDTNNLLTNGIGHLLRAPTETEKYPLGAEASPAQIQVWYEQDSTTAIKGAQRLLGIDVWGELSGIRKRACADLCYNLGESGLSKFKNFLSSMKSGNFDLAGNSLINSQWYKQVGRRGPNIVTMIVQDVDPLGCDKKFPQPGSASSIPVGGTVVVGDSVAIGIGQNIPGSVVNASVGFSSSKILASILSDPKVQNARTAIISAGGNDIVNSQINTVKLRENLIAIKAALKAGSCVWILPYDRVVSTIITDVAGSDRKVDLLQYTTKDGLHPTDYQAVSAAAIKKF